MSGGFDAEGLDEVSEELLKLGQKQFPIMTKNFMQRAGNQLKKVAAKEYKNDIGKESTHGKARYKESRGKKRRTDLIGGLSRGSAYIYNGDEYQVRVKNKAPHAHLFEHGHAQKVDGKRIEKYVKGRGTMGRSARKFASQYPDMADQFIDELLESGLK